MPGVLEGVKVVEMGLWIAVPAASTMMADWGAEVIKVEPLTGEAARGMIRSQGVESRGVVSLNLDLLNRNKKGLAVDVRKESGRDILYQLIKKSDIFISNYTVDSLRRLKADYASLSQVNPKLIYGVLSGYGTEGPDRDQPGYDYTAAWARSGIQYLLGEPGGNPPQMRAGMVDRPAGATILAGVLAALWHREKTGQGQELHISLYHTGVWTIGHDIQSALVGSPTALKERTKSANPLSNSYRCKDGRWLHVTMLQFHRYWPDFCRAIERPELANDPRFNNPEALAKHYEELVHILDQVFVSKNRAEWEKPLRENNCVYGRIETPEEVVTDPQAIANDFFAEIEHPIHGKIKLINTPVKFRQNPAVIKTLAPELGQHNEEVLLELGYSWEDIARLKEQEVIL